MAYLFNSINSQIDQKPKSNIFDPNAAMAQGQAQQGGQSDVFQTSSASANAASSAGGASAMPPQARAPGSGSGGQTTALQKQKAWGSVAAPDASQQTGKISADISGANQKLQSEANAYQSRAASTAGGYSLDSATLKGAADGDQAAYGKAQARLAKTQPDQFEAFGGLKNSELPTGADAFRSPSGFGEVFRPSSGAGYSQGESQLNSMLLRRSPEFRQTAMQLVSDQDALGKASDTARVDETKKAQDMLGRAFTDATGAARSELKGYGEQVITDAKAREVAVELERAGIDPKTLSAAEFQKLAENFKSSAKGLDPNSEQARSLKYLDNPSDFDLSKYVNIDKDVDFGEFIDEAGASKYNRVNALLGSQSPILQAGKASEAYSFDTEGARLDLGEQLRGKRQAEDRGLKDEIAATMGSAGRRAGADQGDALKNAQDYVTRQYLDRNEGQTADQMRAEQETFRQLFNPETNWTPYYTQQGGLKTSATPRTAADMLTPQEAAAMSDKARQAGTGETFAAGSQYNQPNYDAGYFDTRFKTTFDRILGELAGTVPMTSNQGTASSQELGQGLGRDRTVNPLVDEQERARMEAQKIAMARSINNNGRRR